MSTKIIIIALVAVLSGIFFWQTTNRFLYPSKAGVSTSPTPLPFLVPPSSTPAVVAPTTSTGTVPTLPSSSTSGSSTSPTGSPTSGVCDKSKGDFNCDRKTSLLDFELWRAEFTGALNTKTADANADGQVTLVDFEAWRKGMFP